jgi:hypothetical protein
MSKRSFAASRLASTALRDRTSVTSIASNEFAYDAPEFKSAAVMVSDAPPTVAGFDQTISVAPPGRPRSIWILAGALAVSIMLITLAVIATARYL